MGHTRDDRAGRHIRRVQGIQKVTTTTNYMPPTSALQQGGVPAAYYGQALTSAHTILNEFLFAGQPLVIALAAVVNSYAESRLDPQATYGVTPWTRPPVLPENSGHSEKSSGLFMLNPDGAGRGMSALQRWDPLTNTRRILSEVEGPAGLSLRQAVKADAPLSQLVALFERDIERPEVTTGRAIYTSRLYPKLANTRASALDRMAPPISAMTRATHKMKRLPWYAWLGVALAAFGGTFFLFRRR